MAKKRKKRPVPCPPPPKESARMYIQIAPSNVGRFRFFLEAHDNLGLFTVADKFKAILLLRYSPQQEREFKEFIKGMHEEMELKVLHEGALLNFDNSDEEEE
ncbi:MAG: DUF4911 domain-containing protein [Desulfovibrio sp.]